MDRRTCLAGVGTVAIAGCLGLGDRFGDSDDDENTESDEDSQPTSEADPDPHEGSPTTTEDPQSEADSEPAVDDRQQSTDEIEFERSLDKAERRYRLALQEYGRSAGGTDPTFIDVLPSTDLKTNNARTYLNEANDILWHDTRDLATTAEEEAMVREYRTYDDLIPDLARIQRYIHRAYTRIEPVESEPLHSSPPSELASAKADYEAVGEEMAEMEIYMDEIRTKYDQQAWQIELLDRMFVGLVNVGHPRSTSSQTQTQLRLAREEFRTVTEELEDPTSAPPEETTDQELLKLATEWYELADEALREMST